MLNWLKRQFAPKTRTREVFDLGRIPEGLYANREMTPDSAMTLSPFWAGVRLFQSSVGSLPLVTYKDGEKGRERAKTHPAYYLLHSNPNPAMQRATFFEHLIRDLFLHGEFFAQVIWSGNGKPKMLLPVPWSAVSEVTLNDDWTKTYTVQTVGGAEYVEHADMVHVINYPDPSGPRGLSFLKFAHESMALHKQIQTAGASFFQNAARPSGQIVYPGAVGDEAANKLAEDFDAKYSGRANQGKTVWFKNGGKWEKLDSSTAEEARIVEALGLSVPDIARWLGCAASDLGDRSASKYNSLAADKADFYSRSARPLYDKIELAFNTVLFGVGSDYYCEFLTDALLRADPLTQSQVDNAYIQSGVYTRQEVRRWKNLPDIEGLDVPTMPINMGGNPEATTVTTPAPTEGGTV